MEKVKNDEIDSLIRTIDVHDDISDIHDNSGIIKIYFQGNFLGKGTFLFFNKKGTKRMCLIDAPGYDLSNTELPPLKVIVPAENVHFEWEECSTGNHLQGITQRWKEKVLILEKYSKYDILRAKSKIKRSDLLDADKNDIERIVNKFHLTNSKIKKK